MGNVENWVGMQGIRVGIRGIGQECGESSWECRD